MIMKTVQKGSSKIDHVEYGDNILYFYSSKSRYGHIRTEVISRRITDRIMQEYTDEEYNTLLETVIKSGRGAVSNTPLIHNKKKRSCRSCKNNGTCKGVRSCIANFA
jgi:hypothetical protein